MRDERGERAGQGLHPRRVTQGEFGLDGFHNHHLHHLTNPRDDDLIEVDFSNPRFATQPKWSHSGKSALQASHTSK